MMGRRRDASRPSLFSGVTTMLDDSAWRRVGSPYGVAGGERRNGRRDVFGGHGIGAEVRNERA